MPVGANFTEANSFAVPSYLNTLLRLLITFPYLSYTVMVPVNAAFLISNVPVVEVPLKFLLFLSLEIVTLPTPLPALTFVPYAVTSNWEETGLSFKVTVRFPLTPLEVPKSGRTCFPPLYSAPDTTIFTSSILAGVISNFAFASHP